MEKLRRNKQKPISRLAGEKLKGELNAVRYIECSALTQVLYLIHMVHLWQLCAVMITLTWVATHHIVDMDLFTF